MSLRTKDYEVVDITNLNAKDLELKLNELAAQQFYLVTVASNGLAIFRFKRG